MRHSRVLLAVLIALSLVTGSVASAWAAARMAAPMTDTAADDVGMEDCQNATKQQGHGDCPCCDTPSKCLDAAACINKCSGHLVGYLFAPLNLIAPTDRPDRRADPPEPPDRSIKPPAPPPKA